jgi:predicted Zn finger-like uncharacterized protein
MYTRCPACHAVHSVSAALLAAAGGDYRCARCSKVNNALECLFDELPAAGDRPPAAGDLPVLGLPIDLEGAARAREGTGEDDTGRPPTGGRNTRRLAVRAAWILAAVIIVGFSAVRLAEFSGQPLLDRDNLARIGLVREQDSEPTRNLDLVQLVRRELRSHPSQPGKLRLSATMVNRADHRQRFPAVEIALQDAAGTTLSTQRFEPPEYLGEDRAGASMAPGAYVPFVVDLDDPGEQAVGFELEFR